MPRRPRELGLLVSENLKRVDSFRTEQGKFEQDGVKIDESGVEIDGTEAAFETVSYDQLEMNKTIGRGASSTVQLATHKSTGQMYAVKNINMYDKSKRHQLLSELQALYVSDCTALVRFYGATFHEGTVSVVLEYMDLGGLDHVLRKFGAIPERVLASIAFQVLWGLAYLKHEKRVHRDIKPQNILINSVGEVKLTDFGISKALADSIMCQTFVGSFKYMSPERMKHSAYSYSSDIWSLGIVLHECAMGKYPYPESSSAIGYVFSVTDGDPPTLPADRFSEPFREFLDACLHKNPETRLPADVLLASPWLSDHGATSLDDAIAIVKEWLDKKDVSSITVHKLPEELTDPEFAPGGVPEAPPSPGHK